MKLLACTDKGLIEFEFVNVAFKFKSVHFRGLPTGYFDSYQNQWRVAINHKHWGSKIHASEDAGISWREIPAPKFPEHLHQGSDVVTLRSIWNITGYDKNKFYVGTEPAAIFHTSDNGKNYEFSEGMWYHPTRSSWVGGGKGSINPFLHHIVIDPNNNKHLYSGISCAGVLESMDGGKTWEMINEGLRADFLPETNSEVGHDPHCLKMSYQNPLVIWQQNHCGIFRTVDGGKQWKDLTNYFPENGYGFAITVDPNNDERAWVIPCESDNNRIAPNNALSVYTTIDAGKNWKKLSKGLPQQGAFDIVLRHAFDISDSHLVFGTNNGNLYHSDDSGESWKNITNNLSTIRCVKLLD